jgi:hypothetical protein
MSDRNNIFNEQDSSQDQYPTHIAAKNMLGSDVQTEIIPLPSLGKIYPAEFPLHNCERVEIRPMTAREEDILTSRALAKKGTIVTELIKSCLIDKNINVNSLISGDRNAIMVAIRVTGYGQEYDVDIACPSCSHKYKNTFDLNSLPIKTLDIDPIESGKNEFEFILPMSKKRITFKLLNGFDEEEINTKNEKMKKLGNQIDNLITTRLNHSIVSIDGNYNRNDIYKFVSNMKAGDSLAFRRYMDKIEPGIEMKQEATCPSCDHSEEVTVPIGVNFFWPNS